MKRTIAVITMVLLLSGIIYIPAYSLSQDPIIFDAKSVTYGEGQNSLIVSGHFVNTSNKPLLSIAEVEVEVTAGGAVIASGEVDVTKERIYAIAVGDAAPWTVTLNNPTKGVNLSNAKVESRITYNSSKAQDISTGKMVYYKGVEIPFDVKPAIISGRLMIPARAVFEKMGCTVEWNSGSKSVVVTRNGRIVNLFIDNPIMTVAGTPIKLDIPATIIGGRTLVPLRAITNALGANITYGELNEMAVIYE